jgi:hypothetical protein
MSIEAIGGVGINFPDYSLVERCEDFENSHISYLSAVAMHVNSGGGMVDVLHTREQKMRASMFNVLQTLTGEEGRLTDIPTTAAAATQFIHKAATIRLNTFRDYLPEAEIPDRQQKPEHMQRRFEEILHTLLPREQTLSMFGHFSADLEQDKGFMERAIVRPPSAVELALRALKHCYRITREPGFSLSRLARRQTRGLEI